jgi:hypothetical protein
MRQTAINRQQLELAIANIIGAVKRINELKYVVKSQNGNGDYEVNSTNLGWTCACPDHKFRGVKCKHIFAVEISFALHKEVEVARIARVRFERTCLSKQTPVYQTGTMDRYVTRAFLLDIELNQVFEVFHLKKI